MADINAIMTKSIELDWRIESLLKFSTFYDYDDLSGLHYDYEDGEQLFLADELKSVMDKLADVHDRISYMARPIREVSKLHKNSEGRYETRSGHYYTSGCRIEAFVKDDYREVPYWTRTRVEHDGTDYYLVGYKGVKLNGLTVRVREVA